MCSDETHLCWHHHLGSLPLFEVLAKDRLVQLPLAVDPVESQGRPHVVVEYLPQEYQAGHVTKLRSAWKLIYTPCNAQLLLRKQYMNSSIGLTSADRCLWKADLMPFL